MQVRGDLQLDLFPARDALFHQELRRVGPRSADSDGGYRLLTCNFVDPRLYADVTSATAGREFKSPHAWPGWSISGGRPFVRGGEGRENAALVLGVVVELGDEQRPGGGAFWRGRIASEPRHGRRVNRPQCRHTTRNRRVGGRREHDGRLDVRGDSAGLWVSTLICARPAAEPDSGRSLERNTVAMRTRVLMVTDVTYQARGRRYCDEDIYLSARLREHFDLALCNPRDAASLMSSFDVVVIRNSGPTSHYQDAYEDFRARAIDVGTKVHCQLTGKADQVGKQYLLDLTKAGFRVIPTVDSLDDAVALGEVSGYVVKPRRGADSMGLKFLDRDELSGLRLDGLLLQPRIDFEYEVSFYFVDDALQYALHAPDPDRRWELVQYEPTLADREFAQSFIDWNAIEHGIQRVDACRTRGGELLLVELEDLNPYLSLDLVDDASREALVTSLVASVRDLAAS